ncbi:hypothetical protein [Kribbella steppae]|uniref:hypothetical protein n=1 Tax=Kribbella steppae TaxID=2512223 RepID=UPI00104B212A|nr:hypothetical protein [Kribbella steppae]
MSIRTARPSELPLLQSLELAAGVLFRDIGMTDVAEHPPPVEVFEHFRQAGLPRDCSSVTTGGPLSLRAATA